MNSIVDSVRAILYRWTYRCWNTILLWYNKLSVFKLVYFLSWSLKDSHLTNEHTGALLYWVSETIVRPIQVWRWRYRWSWNKEELSNEKLAVLYQATGNGYTRWNLSDLFGVLTLPYGFRQNWNAKQNSKSFKAVNRNCQVLQSQLWGSKTMVRKRGALHEEKDVIFFNSHLLNTV